MAVEAEKPRQVTGAAAPLSKALPDVAVAGIVVPEAYVWPKEELAHVAHDDYADDDGVPVIDLGDEEEEVRGRIRGACASSGFFQVVNHGVDPALLERAHAASRTFFDLPLATKELLECTLQGDRLLGYGFFESNKLKASRRLWSEGLFVDIPRVATFAATLWPHDHATQTLFSETMEEYFGAVRELGVRVFRLILSSLGVECSEAQTGRFSPKEPALIRLNHYPPCPDPSLTTGLIPHHDANLITVLHQGDVGGLQVMREGRWYAVRPHPEAFAINAGNMLQVISNDLYKSALHKAVVNKDEDRYSLAYFVQAPDWERIAPLPELVDAEHPAKYRPFTWTEYLTSQQVQSRPTSALEYFEVESHD